VRRLAWPVLCVRSTLRRLVRVADGSSRALTDGGYPVQRVGTRGARIGATGDWWELLRTALSEGWDAKVVK
jgi:hypothetical protein